MKKTLIWEILQHLSPKKLKAFDTFLISPFFNLRKDIVNIYRFLMTSILENNKIPSKVEVLQSAFPNEAYDDKKMGLMLSYLHKILERYLWMQEFENTDFEKDKFLISAYRKNNMLRNFNRTIRKVNKKIIAQPLRNPAHYFTRSYLENQIYLSLAETGRAKALNLEEVEKHLDFAYVSTKLQQTFFMLSHQNVFDMHYDSVLFKPIMALAQQDVYKKEPSIVLFHKFIILFQNGGLKEFIKFKPLLFQQMNSFTKTEFRDLYLLALNFCIKNVNNNQPGFYAETYSMYKKGLEMKLLLNHGQLSHFTYTNIVGIAIRQQELLWVEDFIHRYKNKLDKAHKTATFNLNIARLEFAKKSYTKALRLLQKADYDDLINHMTAKILQLKIYYELKEFNSFDSLVQSLRVFIQRKKRIGYHYQIWKNLLRFALKLRKVNPYSKRAVEALKEKIKAEKILPEREWLLKQLE